MKENISIVKASEKDAKEISEIIRKEFPYFSLSEAELIERLNRGTIVVFKALSGKKFAGFIEIEFLEGNEARINGLTVKEEFRGQKIAKSLLSQAISFLKEKGIERVMLLVKQSNETAKALYKQFGFEFIGLYHKKLDNDIVEELELSLIEERPSYAA